MSRPRAASDAVSLATISAQVAGQRRRGLGPRGPRLDSDRERICEHSYAQVTLLSPRTPAIFFRLHDCHLSHRAAAVVVRGQVDPSAATLVKANVFPLGGPKMSSDPSAVTRTKKRGPFLTSVCSSACSSDPTGHSLRTSTGSTPRLNTAIIASHRDATPHACLSVLTLCLMRSIPCPVFVCFFPAVCGLVR